MLRRSKIRKSFIDMWLEYEAIEADLGELANMDGRNQLGFQDSQRVSDQAGEFARCEEVAKSLRNGRMVRREIIDISDIRRRSESDLRSRGREGDPRTDRK